MWFLSSSVVLSSAKIASSEEKNLLEKLNNEPSPASFLF